MPEPKRRDDMPSDQHNLMRRLREELVSAPFNAWLGPVAERADEAGTVIRLPYRPEFSYHPSEPVFHGGVICALADIAGYATVAIRHDHPTPTTALAVDFLAPARGAELVARTQLRKLGRSLARVDVDVMVGDRLVAIGRGTFSTGAPSR